MFAVKHLCHRLKGNERKSECQAIKGSLLFGINSTLLTHINPPKSNSLIWVHVRVTDTV